MIWTEEIVNVSNETVKVYIAEIVGPHPRYGLARNFIRYKRVNRRQTTYYSAEITRSGVYEARISYFSKPGGKFLRCEQEWFVLLEEDYYAIDGGDVPAALAYMRHYRGTVA